ncbi:MAG: pyridoxal-phosphate dependent enzyme, partial [Amphiplicatus sp.]
TPADANIHNIAVEGSFDDCQSIVKAIFSDRAFCERHSISGVNSINWARLAIQTVYYFTAIAVLRAKGETRAPSFCVPTGNFGDVFAGYAAKKMGADIGKLCVAVNDNDIMHRALTTGDYAPRGVTPTSSPSMDIQVASNFERLLFEASSRDADAVRELMAAFARDGKYSIPAPWLAAMREDFTSERAEQAEGEAAIKRIYRDFGMVIDPHTAVAVAAMEKARATGELEGPVIALSTAHPAKFPDAVEQATGVRPAIPPHVGDLFAQAERYETAPADIELIKSAIETARGR